MCADLLGIVVIKRCRCGCEYTASAWSALEYVGRMPLSDETDAELRNCACRSTIAIEVPVIPAATNAAVAS